MTDDITVGIIGGGGWLGGAIAASGLRAGVLSPASLVIGSRSPRGDRLSGWPEVAWTQDDRELVRRSDVIVVSVRPEQVADLSLDLDGRLVVSVMAGVSIATLRRDLHTDRVVRSMPNAAAEIAASYSPWVATAEVTSGDRAFVRALLGCCGTEDEVETEEQVDYLTGLAGSGPAIPALLASAMIAHAERTGLSPLVARRAVQAVICGAVGLLGGDRFEPAETVDGAIAYDGTTAAALRAMIASGLPGAVADGLDAATAKAADLRRATEA